MKQLDIITTGELFTRRHLIGMMSMYNIPREHEFMVDTTAIRLNALQLNALLH